MHLKPIRTLLFISIAIASCVIVLLSSCSKEAESPIRIGSTIWPGYELLYLARDLGYYDDTPIELVDFPSGTEAKRAYLNGDLEGATMTADGLISMKEKNLDVQAVLVTDVSNGGDVVLGSPTVTELSELKGKRIGVEASSLGSYMLARTLETSGLKATDVEIVPISFAEHKSAFLAEEVDAVITFEPVRSQLLNQGANLLFDSSQIPGEVVDILTLKRSVIEEQPESLNALIDGWFKAYDYFLENPQDGAERMARREGITPEEFLASLELLHTPDLEENAQLLGKGDRSLNPVLQDLSEIMKSNGILKTSVDLESLLTSKPVEALR